MADSLAIVPCTIQDAKAFVDQVHRHHEAPDSALWAVAVARVLGVARVFRGGALVERLDVLADDVCGVAIVGRPKARALQVGGATAEVVRLATDGTPNACSKLYAACRRAALALGYRKVITYTLSTEGGGRSELPDGASSLRSVAARGRALLGRASTGIRRRRSFGGRR